MPLFLGTDYTDFHWIFYFYPRKPVLSAPKYQFNPRHPCSIPDDGVCALFISEQYK